MGAFTLENSVRRTGSARTLLLTLALALGLLGGALTQAKPASAATGLCTPTAFVPAVDSTGQRR